MTRRQALFAEQYVATRGNAKKAAMLAYQVANEVVAAVTASKNLRNAKVMSDLI